jgi:hypothetical protein
MCPVDLVSPSENSGSPVLSRRAPDRNFNRLDGQSTSKSHQSLIQNRDAVALIPSPYAYRTVNAPFEEETVGKGVPRGSSNESDSFAGAMVHIVGVAVRPSTTSKNKALALKAQIDRY